MLKKRRQVLIGPSLFQDVGRLVMGLDFNVQPVTAEAKLTNIVARSQCTND
jgi:hypothetical protein